jgi:hypothetical protein
LSRTPIGSEHTREFASFSLMKFMLDPVSSNGSVAVDRLAYGFEL